MEESGWKCNSIVSEMELLARDRMRRPSVIKRPIILVTVWESVRPVSVYNIGVGGAILCGGKEGGENG